MDATFVGTPLTMAAVMGDMNLVKLLVQRGGDVSFKDDQGLNPLLHSVLTNNLEMFRELSRNIDQVDCLDDALKHVTSFEDAAIGRGSFDNAEFSHEIAKMLSKTKSELPDNLEKIKLVLKQRNNIDAKVAKKLFQLFHLEGLEAEEDSTGPDVDMAIQMVRFDDAEVTKDAQQMLSKLEQETGTVTEIFSVYFSKERLFILRNTQAFLHSIIRQGLLSEKLRKECTFICTVTIGFCNLG